jgi:hypothetical protein
MIVDWNHTHFISYIYQLGFIILNELICPLDKLNWTVRYSPDNSNRLPSWEWMIAVGLVTSELSELVKIQTLS